MVIILIIVIFGVISCSNSNKELSNKYENTTWETGLNSIYFKFENNGIEINTKVTPETTPSDLDFSTFDLDKYIFGLHKNITVKNEQNKLIIKNEDGLNLEFEILSDTELMDEKGNIFIKR